MRFASSCKIFPYLCVNPGSSLILIIFCSRFWQLFAVLLTEKTSVPSQVMAINNVYSRLKFFRTDI
jgi:hypothetical protein